MQIPNEDLPAYDSYTSALQPIDDALASRVIAEYWAAYGDAAAEHDMTRAELVKAFRDK